MGRDDIQFVFSFSPLHSEHSDAQLWYIGCCNTVLCPEDRQQSEHPYGVSKFSFSSYCDNVNGHTPDSRKRLKQVHRQYLALH